MPQLANEVQGYIYQQDGAPPHWHKEVREYRNEHLPGRWVGRAADTDNTFCTWPPRSPDLTVCDFLLWGFVKDNVYVPPLPKTISECDSASTPQSGTSHETCLRGFGGNWSIAWTSTVSHEGRTSNAFKVTMKLQTFLFQMVVTSCISVQYLWKYGFKKSSDNLYAPCTLVSMCPISFRLTDSNYARSSLIRTPTLFRLHFTTLLTFAYEAAIFRNRQNS